jgi:hypothetical protein
MKMFTAKCNFLMEWYKNITLGYRSPQRQDTALEMAIKAGKCPMQSRKKGVEFR